MSRMEYTEELSKKHIGMERSVFVESGTLGGATPKVLVLVCLDVGERLVFRSHGGYGLLGSAIAEELHISILAHVHHSFNRQSRASAFFYVGEAIVASCVGYHLSDSTLSTRDIPHIT